MEHVLLAQAGDNGSSRKCRYKFQCTSCDCKLLGAKPILFGFDTLACATGSWVKAMEEYSNTMSASSPPLASQGCTGLSDCRQ